MTTGRINQVTTSHRNRDRPAHSCPDSAPRYKAAHRSGTKLLKVSPPIKHRKGLIRARSTALTPTRSSIHQIQLSSFQPAHPQIPSRQAVNRVLRRARQSAGCRKSGLNRGLREQQRLRSKVHAYGKPQSPWGEAPEGTRTYDSVWILLGTA